MELTLDLAREREAQRPAVGIAPRRADIVDGAGVDAIDRDVDRLLESMISSTLPLTADLRFDRLAKT